MSWSTALLSEVAPSKPLKVEGIEGEQEVWQLNLNQIESNTGRLLEREFQSFSSSGTSTHWFDERYVLYSKLRPYLNKVLLPNQRGLGTTELVPMLPDGRRLNRKYLAYYLRSKKFVDWVSGQTAGAKMPRVSMKVFWTHKIPLPPLPEQKKIAEILDAADSLRQKDQQLIEHYNTLSQSLFLDMFGDYFKQENCYKSIREVANFIDYRGKTPSRTDSGVPLISAKCVRPGWFNKARLDFITNDIYQKVMTRGFPKVGDVLFTTEGATMGYTCRIPVGFDKFAVGQRLITLQSNNLYNNTSLEFVLNSREIQGEVFKLATGSAAKGIRSAKFKEILIPVPPIEIQTEFSKRIELVERQKQQVQVGLQKSENLFNCLLQRAFKGELTS